MFFFLFSSLVNKPSMMASKYSIKRLEQQKAKVLEVQATTDCKIQEAEEHKCQMEAEKAMKMVKKEEEKRVRLLLKQQAKVEKKPKAPAVRVHPINLFILYTRK